MPRMQGELLSTVGKMRPLEAFRRGFYGGLGFWCSFMALNIVAALLGLLALMALGIVGRL